jgi:hypothetical protein
MKSLRILINLLVALILLGCAAFAARGIKLVYDIVALDNYHQALLSSKDADTTPGLVIMLEAVFAAAIIVVFRKLLFIWIDRQK